MIQIIPLIILLLVLLVIGMPVAFAVTSVALVGIVFVLGGGPILEMVASTFWSVSSSWLLCAVPTFVIMGEILLVSGIGKEIYDASSKWFSRIPGALGITTIVTAAVLSAATGSSATVTAMVGRMGIPEMEKKSYNPRIAAGSAVAGGGLGILIPPSIPLIIYGAMLGEDVGKLFMAGLIPGIILMILYTGQLAISGIIRPENAPSIGPVKWRERLRSIRGLIAPLILVGVVLGTIYLGLASPTEAGGGGVIVLLLICSIQRRLTWGSFQSLLINSARMSCMILFLVMSGSLLSQFLTIVQFPQQIAAIITSLPVPLWVIFSLLVVGFGVMGCFIDGLSMMVITLPILHIALLGLGVDILWFGVIMVLLIEIGQITPPFGINLLIIQGISDINFEDILKGSLPFLLSNLLLIVLLYLLPQLALWLPSGAL